MSTQETISPQETASTQEATLLGPERFLGEIIHVPFTFAPRDYVPCDGRLLPINQHLALFSLLEFRFGGNGTTHFAVPNYNHSLPREQMYVISLTGFFPSK